MECRRFPIITSLMQGTKLKNLSHIELTKWKTVDRHIDGRVSTVSFAGKLSLEREKSLYHLHFCHFGTIGWSVGKTRTKRLLFEKKKLKTLDRHLDGYKTAGTLLKTGLYILEQKWNQLPNFVIFLLG